MNGKRVALRVVLLAVCVSFVTISLAGCGSREVTGKAEAIDVSNLPAEQQMFVAAQRGDLATLKAGVEGRPDAIDLRDDVGRTLLHVAAEADSPETVSYLLEKGADPAAQDNEGRDALTIASESRSSQKVLDLLTQAGK